MSELDWTVIEKHRDDMKAKLEKMTRGGKSMADPFAELFDVAVCGAQYEMCEKLLKARLPTPVNG